ncbi:phosphate acetyltransferase [Marinobacterium arenosum]|uniref:phosphate acetyltransferase n=1 Tax=Marinobacterium arenosum TaxID=2862496 RepID=UPI001C93F032|nr:phosphate acetyltransferase [Marinobacterium arenosum]MBY4677139.1 phosphate acetyltransferase [Marinobacterium arenosum]
MSQALMVVPTGLGAGLTTAVLGLFHAMDRQGIKVHFFKPIAQPVRGDETDDRSIEMLQPSCEFPIAQAINIREAEHLVSEGRGDELLEEIVARYEQSLPAGNEVVIIEGMVPTHNQPYATRINKEIAKALDAQVVLVAAPGNDTPAAFEDHIDITARAYGGIHNPKVLGCILNKLDAPVDREGRLQPDGDDTVTHSITEQVVREHCRIFSNSFRILGCIPWDRELIAPRVRDIAEYLNARVINQGELDSRRVKRITMCARTVANAVEELKPGTLVFTPGDRDDIILATCLAGLNGVDLAALVLTGGIEPSPTVMKLCAGAHHAGLPVLSVSTDSWQTARNMPRLDREIPADDLERVQQIKEATAAYIDSDWLQRFVEPSYERRLSPPAFRYQLIERARRANKIIVLPEGDEPRTVKAAAICAQRGIARCALLGDPEEIHRVAKNQDLELGEGVEIFDPAKIRNHYVGRMVELRKHKGMTEIIAAEQLQDNVVLATLMLEMGHVDGLVSGAVHTTANTIRPPLQLIKTAPDTNLVSSVFFMCLPDQVLVYGDCAINPDPNAEQLADIAIQSADSARAFGIPPRVAMISYSTRSSGHGADVDKVREATRIAKEKRPDLLIDGPLQYDAAVMESVAQSKAPGSSVAGKATVFVFPDLNTGNTTYKAVQRSADVISIGPMLQGMRKPVNDLSRGALVDDIVFTIALTAIQADAG